MPAIRFILLLCACGLLLWPLYAQPAEPATPPPPSFKAGAKVTLELTLKAPRGWQLNHTPELLVELDANTLKQAPVSAEKLKWSFKFSKYVKEYTASIPLTVKGKAADGSYPLKLNAACVICDDTGKICSFASEDCQVKLVVRNKAPQSEKNQAQAKGSLAASHTFSPPE